jgi:prophage regulatory protein
MNRELLIRINELASHKGRPGMVPVSPATLWRWVKAGKFPAPVRLSDRVTAWEASKVNAWIQSRSSEAQA